jgi:hypothetical protein
MADRSHLAAVQAEDELPPAGKNSHAPLTRRREVEREHRRELSALRHHTHELHNLCVHNVVRERVTCCQPKDISCVADYHVRLKRQSTRYLGAQVRPTNRLAHDKCACRANVQDVELFQLLREGTRAKSPVPAYIDAFEKSDECHRCDLPGLMLVEVDFT